MDTIEAPIDLAPSVCAARGAALLDEKYPDWFRNIDTGHLDMNNYDWCVLGQLYRSESLWGSDCDNTWTSAMRSLNLSHEDTVYYGFYAAAVGEYPAFTLAWMELIEDRRDDSL